MFLRHPDISSIIIYRDKYTERLQEFISQCINTWQEKEYTYQQCVDYLALAVQDTELEAVILSRLLHLWPLPVCDTEPIDHTRLLLDVKYQDTVAKRGRPKKV